MKLMYITAEPRVAVAAESAGVDWLFVDLEINGKLDRQGHLDTVISRHTFDDVSAVRSVLTKSKLLVRVNPINDGSAIEIDRVIAAGADVVMLPYFHSTSEVDLFLEMVASRALTCLLVETPAAVSCAREWASRPGIDYVHVGMNDLHIAYGLKFMFEPLADGLLDQIAATLKDAGVEFGFGGIARLGEGAIPAERILAEHRRIGSSLVILSRSFLPNSSALDSVTLVDRFEKEVARIRKYELFLDAQSPDFFVQNRAQTAKLITEIASARKA